MRRRRKQPSAAEKQAHDRFTEQVLASGPCLFSISRPGHECSGPMDPHHLIRAQLLRTNWSTYSDEEKWERVYAPEIGAPLCRHKAHAPVTRRSTYVYLEEVPATAVDWADENGIRHLLDFCCPSLREQRKGVA